MPGINGQEDFRKLEAHVRKALTKFTPDINSKIGLIGELYILLTLLGTNHLNPRDIISSWRGHSHTSRDFIFKDTCIEVKTTTGRKSYHNINNLNQVDPRDDDGGITSLFLGSLGIELDPNGSSIVDLTNGILDKIGKDDELKEYFLTNLSAYGVNTIGYHHERMQFWEQFNQKFTVSFSRFYDMGDPNIRLIRFSDLDGMTAINEKTVSYQITLEENIVGSQNNPMKLDDFVHYFLKT